MLFPQNPLHTYPTSSVPYYQLDSMVVLVLARLKANVLDSSCDEQTYHKCMVLFDQRMSSQFGLQLKSKQVLITLLLIMSFALRAFTGTLISLLSRTWTTYLFSDIAFLFIMDHSITTLKHRLIALQASHIKKYAHRKCVHIFFICYLTNVYTIINHVTPFEYLVCSPAYIGKTK